MITSIASASLVLGLHLASIHAPDRGQNNTNPGVYVMYDGWTAGTYYNSFKRQSTYLGYTWAIGPVDLTLGAVNGYKMENVPLDCATANRKFGGNWNYQCYETKGWSHHEWAPMLVPSVKLGPARLFLIPAAEKNRSWVFHLGIEKEF